MNHISKDILSACINRNEFREQGEEYYVRNIDLAVSILNLIDGVKEALERKLKVNLDSQELKEKITLPVDDDNDGVINELTNESHNFDLAMTLLGETSRNGYERIRKVLSVPLPSSFIINKTRPAVEKIAFGTQTEVDNSAPILNQHLLNPDSSLGDEQALMLYSTKNKNRIEGARLVGDYKDYISIIEKKHISKGLSINQEQSTLVVDSIDGAEHSRSKKEITSVISFSTMLTTPDWINSKKMTAGSSHNILTWQNLRGKEDYETMMLAVKDYFQSKRALITAQEQESTRSNYWYYNMHDCKMLYLLTQHSLWNRIHHPFLLCKCKRGIGLQLEEHSCVIRSDHETEQLYKRSERKWKRKLIHLSQGEVYDMAKHRNWVDNNNEGVSHFGVNPILLPPSSIRFDSFHLKCSITKRLMSWLRELILNQSIEKIHAFTDVLSSFWNDYHLFVWRTGKPFTSFQGNELALFVANINTVCKFLNTELVQTTVVNDITKGLKLWVDLFKFLGITNIDVNSHWYKREIEIYEKNAKEFYEVGHRTFLSKGTSVGSEETCYMHVMRYYIPQHARLTLDRHGLGIGVFCMQGFERRNKESKNIYKRFSNHSSNVMPTILGRLWDVFKHEKNPY